MNRPLSTPQGDQVLLRVPAHLGLLLRLGAFPEIATTFLPQGFAGYSHLEHPGPSPKTFVISESYRLMLERFGINASEMNVWEDVILPKGWSCEHRFLEGRFISPYILSSPWENTEDNYRIVYKLNEKPVFAVAVYKFEESGWDRVNLSLDVFTEEGELVSARETPQVQQCPA